MTDQEMREKFERDFPGRDFSLFGSSIGTIVYQNDRVQMMWTGYQAAAATYTDEIRRLRETQSVLSVAEDAVIEERRRQVIKEGWTAEHDDEHVGGELAMAGACYAFDGARNGGGMGVPKEWPWDAKWWKSKSYRRDLVRAAALIIAEIERLDRAALKVPPHG